MIDELVVGELYSNKEIFASLGLANAGGIRFLTAGGVSRRAAIFTSGQGFHGKNENPYQERREGDILTYTAEGKIGEQSLSGQNSRMIGQKQTQYPIHGFSLTASRRDKSIGPRRWVYLGLVQCLRHYADNQLGADGKVRKVWLFELRIHSDPNHVRIDSDAEVWSQLHLRLDSSEFLEPEDNEIVTQSESAPGGDVPDLKAVRAGLLAMEPRKFELFLRDLLERSGFADVCVTRFSADAGVDVNARVGAGVWALKGTHIQVQAKRWLHSVGRREIAELRGSLEPFARATVVTTSYFSRAAINEACAPGKNPIVLIDGVTLAKAVLDCQLVF